MHLLLVSFLFSILNSSKGLKDYKLPIQGSGWFPINISRLLKHLSSSCTDRSLETQESVSCREGADSYPKLREQKKHPQPTEWVVSFFSILWWYIYIYIHIYIYVYYIYTYIYIYICIYIYMYYVLWIYYNIHTCIYIYEPSPASNFDENFKGGLRKMDHAKGVGTWEIYH